MLSWGDTTGAGGGQDVFVLGESRAVA